jgi:cell division transport system permease protein
MWSRITYTFREMWASLSRNLTLTAAAVVTSVVSLFLFGLTLLIQQAFDNQLSLWTGGVKMIVYMENGASAETIALVKNELENQPTVIKQVTYCDIPCSLDFAGKLFAGDAATLQQLDASTIPSYFAIEPVNKDDNELLRQLRTQFMEYPKVDDVVYPNEQIQVLSQLKNFIGVRTLVMSVVLLMASVLLIWNTIRTAMFARRREIEVMKLVGATNWFIRLPFMLEGLLQGLAGGALASVFLWFVNGDWTSGVRAFPVDSGLEGFVVTDGYPFVVYAIMLGLGALVGAIGSATAASRFLDV